MRGKLIVEHNECAVEGRIRRVRKILNLRPSLIEKSCGLPNFRPRPVNGVDLFAEQTKETEFVCRSLVTGDSTSRLFGRIVFVQLAGDREEFRLSPLQLIASGEATLIDVGKLFEVSIDKDAFHAAGKLAKKSRKSFFSEVLCRNAGDEKGVGLDRL